MTLVPLSARVTTGTNAARVKVELTVDLPMEVRIHMQVPPAPLAARVRTAEIEADWIRTTLGLIHLR